jgi:hypothetical protein
MPGLGRKLRLFLDWNIALLFGRDTSAPEGLGSPTAWTPQGSAPGKSPESR